MTFKSLVERILKSFSEPLSPPPAQEYDDPTFVFERCLQLPDCTERYLAELIARGFEFSGDRAEDTHADRVRMIREAVAMTDDE